MAQQRQQQQGLPQQHQQEAHDDQQDELVSRLGEGLTSLALVAQLRAPSAPAAITALNLHGNSIAHIEGLAHLSRLVRLNLSSNSIAAIEGLAGLARLTSLNLASNQLCDVRGLGGLTALADLNLSYNAITSLDGLSELHGPGPRLTRLNVAHNALPSLAALAPLAGCLQLRGLRAGGNPATVSPAAYAALRQALPQVRELDEGEAVSIAAGWQLAHAQLQAYGGGSGGQGPLEAMVGAAAAGPLDPWQQGGHAYGWQQGSSPLQPRGRRQQQQQQQRSPGRPLLRAPAQTGQESAAAALQLPPWLKAAARDGAPTSGDDERGRGAAASLRSGGSRAGRQRGDDAGRRQLLRAAARLAEAGRAALGRGGPSLGGTGSSGYDDSGDDDDDGVGGGGGGSRSSGDGGGSGAGSDQGGRRASPGARRNQPPRRSEQARAPLKMRSSSTNTGGAMVTPRHANAEAQTQDSGPAVERLQAEAERLRRELGRVAGGRGRSACVRQARARVVVRGAMDPHGVEPLVHARGRTYHIHARHCAW